MLRVLLIGRGADDWADHLGELPAGKLKLETARLPSSGIRSVGSTPPDAIVIATDTDGDRVETIAEAIRDRPVGKLIPLLVVGPPPDDAEVDERIDALDLYAWHSAEADPSELIADLEELLETDLSPEQPSAAPPDATDDGSAEYFDGGVVLEPIDDGERAPTGESPANLPSHDGDDVPVDEDEIDTKLQTIRHEDYFSILEVDPDAGDHAIREAFHGLYARFDPEKIDVQLAETRRGAIDEIRDALEDAFAVLGDPELREKYR